MHKYSFLLLACLPALNARSQSQPIRKDTLGEVVIRQADHNDLKSTITAADLNRFARNDVARALDILPGITQSAVGPRNESMIYVRGFDLRQVPLLIDGIPVYVPYDGYVDLARFTTFDIAEVNVSKAYTSVLYGPNALGGAINIVTRKPVKPFELDGKTGWQSGGYRTNLNVGSNLGKFYIQAGVSKFKRDSFPLPHDIGGWRSNSYNADQKVNVKVAFRPNERSEYALSYIYQHGDKGTPVYAGTDTKNSLYTSPRFWKWPKWDKRSLYFLSNTAIDSTSYIRTRFYYDKFINVLESYDNATYSTMTKGYAFTSYYNDYTLGGIVEYGKTFSARESLKLSAQYKNDVHREHNAGQPERTMADGTFTFGAENELILARGLTFLTGASFNNRSSLKAQDYNSSTKVISNYASNSNNAFNVQGGLNYQLATRSSFLLSVARKTRFATTKDRYSYRMGTALPNPDLKAEQALNTNLAYSYTIPEKLKIQAGAFYSRISNTIMMVSNVATDTAGTKLGQMQNAGKSSFYGGEASLDYHFSRSLMGGVNYTYIKRKNISNPSLFFTDVPEHKFFAYAQYSFKQVFSVQANGEYNSKRYSTSYGVYASDFALFNMSATVHIWKCFSLEGGINNIGDRNYALVEGYPEPGRNYFVNFCYHL